MTTPSSDQALEFFHSPNTRSTGVLTLLEELGCEYQVHTIDMKAAEQRGAAYLHVNPMGKVPAIRHRGTLVTEQVAVYLYLADAFPQAGLAPALSDPLRGTYLRWLAFYGSSFEPAVVDHALKRPSAPPSTLPYGDYATTVKTLNDHLALGPYMLGATFSAADVLWGTALTWLTGFGLVAETPEIKAYLGRITDRPAFVRVRKIDQDLAASLPSAQVDKA